MADGTRHSPEVIATSSCGFTRRELIVTVACLALLGLIAFSWYARHRDLPGRTVCQANLRQLAAGFNSYETDVGRLPGAARIGTATNDDWIFWQTERLLADSPLAKHTSNFLNIVRCPADTTFSFRGYPYSYSMNANFERFSTRASGNKSRFILLYEEEAPNDGACGVSGPADVLTQRHFRRGNAAFLDGHVELIGNDTGVSRTHSNRP